MAFPTTGILDNFNRSNEGPPPSASWTSDTWGDGSIGLKVVSNTVMAHGTGSCESWWSAASFGNNQEAYITVITKPGNGQRFEFDIRLQSPGTAGADGYALFFEEVTGAGNDIVTLYRVDNGASTQLGATATNEYAANDGIGADAIGSTISTYYKAGAGAWALIASRTDATYVGGYIGLCIRNITGAGDNFGGGTVVAASTQPPRSMHQFRMR